MNKLIFGILAFIYITFLILTSIDTTRDLHHLLGIKEGSIVVKSNIVPDSDWGKITTPSGPLIQVAHVNTNNPKQVILNGDRNYLSLDHGLTWSEIEINNYCCVYLVVWVNNTILASNGKTFMASEDFGASWNPITINTNSNELIEIPEYTENYELSWKSIPLSNLDEETLSNVMLILPPQGNPLLRFSNASKYYFELHNSVLNIKEKYIETAAPKPNIYQDNIQLPNGDIPATLSVSSNGIWAATRGGVFFKKNDGSNWQDKSAPLGAYSFIPGFESQQGNKLLILDQVGRLAISEDKGKSWKPLANQVSRAEFLNDESIVIVQQSGRVMLVDGDDTVEITPDWKLIHDKNPETTSFLYKKNVYFIQGNKDELRLTTCPSAYFPETPIEISHHRAMTRSHYMMCKFTDYYYNRNEKQWAATKPLPPASDFKHVIKHGCELSLDDNNIVSIDGHRTSDYGVAKKVMLIQAGNKYAQFNDSEVHIRKLKNCKPSGLKKVWDFDKIISPAVYYETEEGLEVISLSRHSNKIERIKINLSDTPPLWRRFFYFFYFQYGIYIIGVGLIIWFLNIRRKKSAAQV